MRLGQKPGPRTFGAQDAGPFAWPNVCKCQSFFRIVSLVAKVPQSQQIPTTWPVISTYFAYLIPSRLPSVNISVSGRHGIEGSVIYVWHLWAELFSFSPQVHVNFLCVVLRKSFCLLKYFALFKLLPRPIFLAYFHHPTLKMGKDMCYEIRIPWDLSYVVLTTLCFWY